MSDIKNIILVLLLSFCLFQQCAKEQFPAPVLVLATNAGFGSYTAEILKGEGFNAFHMDSLTNPRISTDFLKQFDIIILAETEITSTQKLLLSDFVKNGGNLIAFRPDKQLSDVFGITPIKGTVQEGYIRIDSGGKVVRGLVTETIQFHGTSDRYLLNGALQLAGLFTDAVNFTGSPSVVVNDYGKGKAVAFTFNLPKSIVCTRQGNPDWAGQERDNIDGPTATDLFYPGEGETQWNNPEKIAIPQADEQMRLLSQIIEYLSFNARPLPRFWYFPDQCKSVFIFTIDGEESEESEINNEIMDVTRKGGHATLYQIGTYISDSIIKVWQSNGHEVAIHYNAVPNYLEPSYTVMNTVFDTMTSNFQNAYGFAPRTGRNHWVVWCSKDSLGNVEFAQQAIIQEKYGIRFDCNYYQFGGNWIYPNWLGDVGHFTGSGIPMKFSDSEGRVIDVYQSNTQLPDETWQNANIEDKAKLLINRSIDNEYYAWINANFHTWYWDKCREPGLRILDYCNNRGIPIWTSGKAYDFLKMKDEASFTDIRWRNNILTFKLISSLQHSNRLSFFIRNEFRDKRVVSVFADGQEMPIVIRRIKGYDYAMVTVVPGKNYKVKVAYNSIN